MTQREYPVSTPPGGSAATVVIAALDANGVPQAVSPSNPLPGTGGSGGGSIGTNTFVSKTSLARPANTTQYNTGTQVGGAAGTAASSIIAHTLIANANVGTGSITSSTLTKNSNVTLNASFRSYFFTQSPTAAVADGVAFALKFADAPYCIGYIDWTSYVAGTDCVTFQGYPSQSLLSFTIPSNLTTLYEVIVAMAAYTPTSGELFNTTIFTSGDAVLSSSSSSTLVGGFTSDAQATITRPANTTAYTATNAAPQGIGTASSSLMTFNSVARPTMASGSIGSAKMTKSSTATAGAQFRLYLYTGTPTADVADQAAFATKFADAANAIGYIDFVNPVTGADCALFTGSLSQGLLQYSLGVPNTKLYGELVVMNAYTPASGEQFLVDLSLLMD
jgi:hypothetical protein